VITFKDFRRKRRFLAVKLLAVLLSLVILNESSDAQKNRNILILQSKTENLLTSRRKRRKNVVGQLGKKADLRLWRLDFSRSFYQKPKKSRKFRKTWLKRYNKFCHRFL